MLCGDLEGWDGGAEREVQEGAYVCTRVVDSLCGTVESNCCKAIILQQQQQSKRENVGKLLNYRYKVFRRTKFWVVCCVNRVLALCETASEGRGLCLS